MSRTAHVFNKGFEYFENAVFDNAIEFHTLAIRGRGVKERITFGLDMEGAFAHAQTDERACVYATAVSGRGIVLDRAKWDYWRKRRNSI